MQSSEPNENSNKLGVIQTAYTEPNPLSNPFVAEDAYNGPTSEHLPGPPRELQAPIVNARFVILSWEPPSINSDGIIAYSVYYKQVGSKRLVRMLRTFLGNNSFIL